MYVSYALTMQINFFILNTSHDLKIRKMVTNVYIFDTYITLRG